MATVRNSGQTQKVSLLVVARRRESECRQKYAFSPDWDLDLVPDPVRTRKQVDAAWSEESVVVSMGGDRKETDLFRQSSHIAVERWRGGMEQADGRSFVVKERRGVMDVDHLPGLVVVKQGHCPAPYPRNKTFQIAMIHEALRNFEPCRADAEYLSGLTLLQNVSLHRGYEFDFAFYLPSQWAGLS